MKTLQFDNLHKTLKNAVLQREGENFVPDIVECRIVDQNEYDDFFIVKTTYQVIETYYQCKNFRGSIAPIKLTKALETWFNNL